MIARELYRAASLHLWFEEICSSTLVLFDKASGNSTFTYEENGAAHTVWLLDAASAWNQPVTVPGTADAASG